jgi:hypothetical protein
MSADDVFSAADGHTPSTTKSDDGGIDEEIADVRN